MPGKAGNYTSQKCRESPYEFPKWGNPRLSRAWVSPPGGALHGRGSERRAEWPIRDKDHWGKTPEKDNTMKTTKSERAKFGLADGPLPCTHLLAMAMDSSKFSGMAAHAILILDEVHGTYTGANVYGGNFGKNYDPQYYTHTLPSKDSDKRKEWTKKGYSPVALDDPRFAGLIVDVNPKAETPAEGEGEEAEADPADATA